MTIIGDVDVGKTSLLCRLVGEHVDFEANKSVTIGVDYKQRNI